MQLIKWMQRYGCRSSAYSSVAKLPVFDGVVPWQLSNKLFWITYILLQCKMSNKILSTASNKYIRSVEGDSLEVVALSWIRFQNLSRWQSFNFRLCTSGTLNVVVVLICALPVCWGGIGMELAWPQPLTRRPRYLISPWMAGRVFQTVESSKTKPAAEKRDDDREAERAKIERGSAAYLTRLPDDPEEEDRFFYTKGYIYAVLRGKIYFFNLLDSGERSNFSITVDPACYDIAIRSC